MLEGRLFGGLLQLQQALLQVRALAGSRGDLGRVHGVARLPARCSFLGHRGRGFFYVLSWNPWTLGSPVWQVCKESRRRMSARERITGPDIRSNSGTTTKEATSQLSSPILGTYWDSGPSTLHFGSLHAWSSVMKCRGHAPFAAWEAWMNCSMGPKFLGRGTVQTTPNAQRPLYLHLLHHS